MPNEVPSCAPYLHVLRADLVASGKVRDGVFTQDVPFDKPSRASSAILGSETNGKREWVDKNGTPLGKLTAAQNK